MRKVQKRAGRRLLKLRTSHRSRRKTVSRLAPNKGQNSKGTKAPYAGPRKANKLLTRTETDLEEELIKLGINEPYCFSSIPIGWKKLLLDTFQQCQLAGWDGQKLAQFKEKFGKLVIYIDDTSDAVDKLLSHAEYVSSHTCQYCSKEGKTLSLRGWRVTICQECKDGKT